ncbi:MAG: hypothetical protein LC808_33905, partial [Actinobacteria bacterium]|nr:hypothetical protein [Actinomycetota bacterium]
PRVSSSIDSSFVLGAGSVISNGHKIDFTDRVEIGPMSVVGGRHSSLWTHSRQQVGPITIGSQAYLGSEIRMAPGTSVPSRCLVGMGAVIVKNFDEEETLIAGVPAKTIRPLEKEDFALLDWQSRGDLPDDLLQECQATAAQRFTDPG